MSYDHSMNATIQFCSGVTIDKIEEALQPILTECGMSLEDARERVTGDNEISLVEKDGRYEVTLSTSGSVRDYFGETVYRSAQLLNPLCEATFFELRDHSTGDLEDSIARIWMGHRDAVVEAKRIFAWREARGILLSHGFLLDEVKAMAEHGGTASRMVEDSCARTSDDSRPKGPKP